MSIRTFFAGEKYNYKFVALGSAIHTLEDRFAKSHTQAIIKCGNEKAMNYLEILSEGVTDDRMYNPQDILFNRMKWEEIITPVVSYQDYSKQYALPFIGAHGKADKFTAGGLTESCGGVEALLVAVRFLTAAIYFQGSQDPQYFQDSQHFLRHVVFSVDQTRAGADKAKRRAGTSADQDSRIFETLADGSEFGYNSSEFNLSPASRQYEKRAWTAIFPRNLRNKLKIYQNLLCKYECDNTI